VANSLDKVELYNRRMMLIIRCNNRLVHRLCLHHPTCSNNQTLPEHNAHNRHNHVLPHRNDKTHTEMYLATVAAEVQNAGICSNL